MIFIKGAAINALIFASLPRRLGFTTAHKQPLNARLSFFTFMAPYLSVSECAISYFYFTFNYRFLLDF